MPKPLTEIQSIEETMGDQFRKTMTVVHAIKGNTEKLLNKTESIIGILLEEAVSKDELQQETDAEVAQAVEVAQTERARPAPDGSIDVFGVDVVTNLHPALVAELTKACVKEVMATINPILDALNKFIKANAIDEKPDQDVDDDLFAEKLIEEMKLSLGRRKRIALARKRFTTP